MYHYKGVVSNEFFFFFFFGGGGVRGVDRHGRRAVTNVIRTCDPTHLLLLDFMFKPSW